MKKRKWIQIIALTLAILLVGGVVVGALVSALAEPQAPPMRCELAMEYLEDEQALRVTQRLLYENRTADRLDAVLFYASGNLFRRLSAMMYDEAEYKAVFSDGYAPGGIDLRRVRFGDLETDYGFQGEEELFLRVACDLPSGQSGWFEFEYDLLPPRCGAFMGTGDTDARFSAFAFVPGLYSEERREFDVQSPLSFTRWLATERGDYEATLTLPEGYALAATGEQTEVVRDEGQIAWRVTAEDVRDFALSFGRRYRVYERTTASGVRIRLLTNRRGRVDDALDAAEAAVERCEAWFGPFPQSELDIAQSNVAEALDFPGLIWLPEAAWEPGTGDDLKRAVREGVARQYFGWAAYSEPVSDAWLSDAVCGYVAMLILEAEEGANRFVAAINREWVSALQQTIPGGLRVTSDARQFDRYAYDIVVRRRGAAVFHELRLAMGLEGLLSGLKGFYERGRAGEILTEMDLVRALDDATGQSWEAFLTDWVFNIGDYVNQNIDWFE